MEKPKCILFAGPGGSGKSPIVNHLSWNLGLPVFSTDDIRTEVLEDLKKTLSEKTEKAQTEIRNQRLEKLLEKKTSFIFDTSIDRSWSKIKDRLKDFDYFVISIDITRNFYNRIGKAKNYVTEGEFVDRWFKDHEDFLGRYKDVVSVTITDENFKDRLEISLKEVRDFLKH